MRALATIALLFLASCGTKVDAPKPAAPSVAAAGVVGTLVEPVADVKLRKAAELVWNAAADRSPLVNYDAIKTAAASRARIDYHDQSAVDVAERSLVIVFEKEKKADAEISVIAMYTGAVRTSLPAVPSSVRRLFLIKTMKGWVRASGRVKASITPSGHLKVENEGGGDVTVLAQGREKPVPEKKTVVIGSDAAAPEPTPSQLEQILPAAFQELPNVPEREWEPASTKEGRKQERLLFEILEPKPKAVLHAERIELKGRVGKGIRAFFKGALVPVDARGKFSLPIDLSLGLNVLTFQVVGPSGVKYETLEVIRR